VSSGILVAFLVARQCNDSVRVDDLKISRGVNFSIAHASARDFGLTGNSLLTVAQKKSTMDPEPEKNNGNPV
jgi:hypothetical protein